MYRLILAAVLPLMTIACDDAETNTAADAPVAAQADEDAASRIQGTWTLKITDETRSLARIGALVMDPDRFPTAADVDASDLTDAEKTDAKRYLELRAENPMADELMPLVTSQMEVDLAPGLRISGETIAMISGGDAFELPYSVTAETSDSVAVEVSMGGETDTGSFTLMDDGSLKMLIGDDPEGQIFVRS